MIRVALNGFGRVGRNILRACYENGYDQAIRIIAINDLGTPEINAHLLRYDTVHGPFRGHLDVEDNAIMLFAQHGSARVRSQHKSQQDIYVFAADLIPKRV